MPRWQRIAADLDRHEHHCLQRCQNEAQKGVPTYDGSQRFAAAQARAHHVQRLLLRRKHVASLDAPVHQLARRLVDRKQHRDCR